MENLIVNRKLTRNLDGSYHCDWFPVNEELIDSALHGQDFESKELVNEYEMTANIELLNVINSRFENPLYKVDENTVEYSRYVRRQSDGQSSLNSLMSELRNKGLENPDPELARTINRAIETAFKDVTQNILLGWWVTAKEKCELVPVGGYVTQELWDRIHNAITSYISENY